MSIAELKAELHQQIDQCADEQLLQWALEVLHDTEAAPVLETVQDPAADYLVAELAKARAADTWVNADQVLSEIDGLLSEA